MIACFIDVLTPPALAQWRAFGYWCLRYETTASCILLSSCFMNHNWIVFCEYANYLTIDFHQPQSSFIKESLAFHIEYLCCDWMNELKCFHVVKIVYWISTASVLITIFSTHEMNSYLCHVMLVVKQWFDLDCRESQLLPAGSFCFVTNLYVKMLRDNLS